MNVYDFDKTIYPKDSTTQFFFFCIRKRPIILRKLPRQLMAFFKFYVLKKNDKTHMKEVFYTFLKDIKDIDSYVELFWEKNEKNVNKWYLEKQKEDDEK